MSAGEQRIDKWLFFARVVKSRSLAQKFAVSGAVRVNREKVAHAARILRPGDVLTIKINDQIRILRVLGASERRGPATEAALLFEDLTPPSEAAGEGRAGQSASLAPSEPTDLAKPTSRERRAALRFREG